MELALTDRVAIVIGATELAAVTARALLAEGAAVAFAADATVSRPADAGDRLRQITPALGGEDRAAAVRDETRAAFGAVDAVVGHVSEMVGASVEEVSEQAWWQAWAQLTDLAAVYHAVLEDLSASAAPRLVLVAPRSMQRWTSPAEELDHVVGMGLLGLHKTLAGELGPRGITVNTVLAAPSAEPEDVAATATYLASTPAGYLTGVTITVDAPPALAPS